MVARARDACALRDRPGAEAGAEGECLGLAGPRRLPGACASISSVPAARGTAWGLRGAGRGVVALRRGGLPGVSEPQTSVGSGFATREAVVYKRWSEQGS